METNQNEKQQSDRPCDCARWLICTQSDYCGAYRPSMLDNLPDYILSGFILLMPSLIFWGGYWMGFYFAQ